MADWRDRAACTGVDVNLFYSDIGRGGAKNLTGMTAKEICDGCPVRAECLEASIQEEMRRPGRLEEEVKGIRGGVFPSERIVMIRARPEYRETQRATFRRNTVRITEAGAPSVRAYDRGVKHGIAHGGAYDEKVMYGYEHIIERPEAPTPINWKLFGAKLPSLDDYPHLTSLG